MKLRSKVLFLFISILALVLVCIGVIIPSSVHQVNLRNVQEDGINQLTHIDFATTNFFREVENDITELMLHENVVTPDDTGFTSFLNASPDTFTYTIGERESEIITHLNAFRMSHPQVNSVYEGRETGTFVRSHPRSVPTAYDPRTRPWYILAKQHPDRIMRTEPYTSLTTPDVNIGIVRAMTFTNGSVYGVLGADVTLNNLTDYISGFQVRRSGEIILINETGTILAARDPALRFSPIQIITGDHTPVLLNETSGIITLGSGYLIFYTSPELGWKYAMILPFQALEKELQESLVLILIFVSGALILLSAITLVILDQTVIRPLMDLTEITRKITETGDLDLHADGEQKGEIGELSRSFNLMISRIRSTEIERKEAYLQLSEYRDHLEDQVRERTSQLESANTLLVTAKEHAEAADRLKSAFLATMSHELRTPLNSIIGFTGIILEGLVGPITAEQAKQLGMVQHSARHLLALINDVLDISKIEADELVIQRELVELPALIENVAKSMEPVIVRKGLELIRDISPEIGAVMGDSRRIEQVLINLLTNAVKFTESGTITISGVRQPGQVRLSVSDTGIGIDERDMTSLFRPFQQIDSGTTRKYEGTGLGLSITKRLIELHGGTITVRSTPGTGSIFSFTLPTGAGIHGE